MKNLIIRLVGILVMIVEMMNLASNISAITLSLPIIWTVALNILSSLVLIYGSYLTIRLNSTGQKLLRIVFTIEIIKYIFFGALILFAIVFLTRPQIDSSHKAFSFPSQDDFLWISALSYFLYCNISVFLISRKNITDNLIADNPQHIERVGKILSVITPGLGQAVVGEYWEGIVRFLTFITIVGGLHFSETISFLPQLTPGIGEAIGKLFIWAFFSNDDWSKAHKYLKEQHTKRSTIDIQHENPDPYA